MFGDTISLLHSVPIDVDAHAGQSGLGGQESWDIAVGIRLDEMEELANLSRADAGFIRG